MKAIVISTYGGPEVLTVTELPDPVPAEGELLIRVRGQAAVNVAAEEARR